MMDPELWKIILRVPKKVSFIKAFKGAVRKCARIFWTTDDLKVRCLKWSMTHDKPRRRVFEKDKKRHSKVSI